MKPINNNVKTTIMHGRRDIILDIILTVRPAFKLKSLIPNAKLEIIEGSSHSTKVNKNYVEKIKLYMSQRRN